MLFDSIAEEVVLRSLRASRQEERTYRKQNCEMAIDYLNNCQKKHVEATLMERYPTTQIGGSGQEICAVTLPMTERYIAEAATAYNKPVTRKIVDIETGDEDTDLTSELKYYLDNIGYDEKMHRVEQLSLLLSVCGISYQERRGQLRPVIAYPQDIYPLVNPDDPGTDPSDPEDYLGFVVEIMWIGDDVMQFNRKTYAAILRDRTIVYTAKDAYSMPEKYISVTPNPFTWPQADESGVVAERPLLMLTFWHKQQYEGKLIVDVDSDIVAANHELNIQWSMLFDTMRLQGWSVPVLEKSLRGLDPQIKWGARFPVVTEPGEAFSLQTGGAPYSAIVDVLGTFARLLAVAKSQSPNDFAINGVPATSGFAKVVDSLPKIEARQSRIARLKRLEEQVAWPRIASILRRQGVFPADVATRYKMTAKFSDIEIPQTEQERSLKLDTDIKYGLTNPIEIIMQARQVSKEEAQAIYDENKSYAQAPPPAQGIQPNSNQTFAALIARRKGLANEGPPTR